MKNLEKILTIVFFITMTSMTFSQTIGVKAGLNLSNMLMKDDNSTYSTDFKMNPGFNLGATVDFPIGEIFSIEPGLILSTRGFKEESTLDIHPWETVTYKSKMNNYYLDIPVNLKAGFNAGNVKIYGLFGPYLGIGLTGKIKTEITGLNGTETEEENVNWGTYEDEDNLKRVDFGLTAGAGVEFYSIILEVSYGYGLLNISPYSDDGFKINNRVLGISAGYRFGSK